VPGLSQLTRPAPRSAPSAATGEVFCRARVKRTPHHRQRAVRHVPSEPENHLADLARGGRLPAESGNSNQTPRQTRRTGTGQ